MNLRQLSRICDMKKEEQTDAVMKELYDLTLSFVRKYWRKYYPSYKGDVEDLASDFYLEFITPKSRVPGKEQTLLDKFDSKVTILPYLVKVSVQRKLIDRSRTDKGEKNYNDSYDEETGELSLDYIASHIDSPSIQVEDLEFTEDEILELRDLYDEMDPEAKKAFLKYYNEVKNVLSDNFKDLFKDIVGE